LRSKWSDKEAAKYVASYGAEWGEPLALRTYTARLLGSEPTLVLHGGGNSSVKALWTDVFGEDIRALFVKASGADMATIGPEGHVGLELEYLIRLRELPELSDEDMLEALLTHALHADSPVPSIEALVHAFLPAAYVDHTHADGILALTNRQEGEKVVAEALGGEVAVVPYVSPGFKLALATSLATKVHPKVRGLVLSHHGLITWGDSARESYELMVDLVSHAESYLTKGRTAHAAAAAAKPQEPVGGATGRPARVAAILRGLLAENSGDPDRPHRSMVLLVSNGPDVMAALAAPEARETLVTPPLTTDHLIRTKALPLWVEELEVDDEAAIRTGLATAIQAYCDEYAAYVARFTDVMPEGMKPFDPKPRVIMIPGEGIFCAGYDLHEAAVARDITEQTVATKTLMTAAGAEYDGLPDTDLFYMEYRGLQHAKLLSTNAGSLRGRVALVTGAAGAIGTGICQGLLEAGCLVAGCDLSGEPLDGLAKDLGSSFPGRVIGVAMDVTDAKSVADAFAQVALTWGGVDIVVPNAGVAAVAPLMELDLEEYRRLERVNAEGTLLVLAEAGRWLRRQATGGDIVLVSTKNVFSPGASFGAYSSTKAAAHQLARIASLELAEDDVRVNMVAPDAVFSHGSRRSGLWAEVGPQRMKARGLDEAGLEAYYQGRNLLKARVTAAHVAEAVLFFVTRRTPTTGATIPVDGGLPDSTPR